MAAGERTDSELKQALALYWWCMLCHVVMTHGTEAIVRFAVTCSVLACSVVVRFCLFELMVWHIVWMK